MKHPIRAIARRLAGKKSQALQLIASLKRGLRKGRRMEIEIITMMYNEAFLAPLFIRHYAPWVDKFTVFYSRSIDGTREELENAAAKCGVKALDIVSFEFPLGFDDSRKIGRINRAVRDSSADFAICVDADEFVHPWPFETTNPRDELTKEAGDVIHCAMFQSYRHATEADIDRTRPPLFQRRHGVTEFSFDPKGDGRKVTQKDVYSKPCIVRPASGAQFAAGCHHLLEPRRGSTIWRGAHWAKADGFCLSRYVRDRRDRLSDENRLKGYGVHLFNTSPEQIRGELKEHENDTKLF